MAGAWDTGTNWSTDAAGAAATIGWTDGNSAIFSAGADGVGAWTASITGTVATPSILIKDAGAKTIAGGTITIGGGAINTVAIGNGDVLTISSVLAGTGGLSINANGDLTVTGDIRLGHWGGGEVNVYNISGGSLNQPDTVTAPTNETQANLFIGIDGIGALNISGTGVVNTSSLVVNGRGGSTSDTLNLTGGRLNIGKWGIRNPGTAIVNLGGGVLGASADWTSTTPMALTGTGGNVTVNTLDSVDSVTARTISLTGVLSGAGGLTKTGAGNLVITGANTYSGATNINAGTLQVGNAGTSGSLGNGNVVNNGSLVVDRNNALTVANVISGTGSFTQDGAGTTTLGGTNTYSGNTIVKEGVLVIDGDSLLDNGTLVVDGGKVEVTNNETVTELLFGAVSQAAGTYGATGSGATNIDDTRFQGTGIVTVTGAGYGSWITGFGLSAPNQSASADPDNDGIDNGVEWVLGGNPATGMDVSKLPVVSTDATNMVFTFKRIRK